MIKHYRKNTVLIAFILVIINFNLAFAYTPKDVQLASSYARESIVVLANKNIISGDENGNYNPKRRVSRGELVTMIVRALDIDTDNIPAMETFKDVPRNHWAFKYVEAAYREGIINGVREDHFDVSSNCTREEMAAIIMRSLRLTGDSIEGKQKITHINKFKDKENISPWAKNTAELAVYTKLMNGTSSTTFSPKGHATREQVAVIIDRILRSKGNLEDLVDRIKLIDMPQISHWGINTANVNHSLGLGLYFMFATPLEDFRLRRLTVETNDGTSYPAQTNISYYGKNDYDKKFLYEFDNLVLKNNYKVYYEAEIRTEFGMKTFEMTKEFKFSSNGLSLYFVNHRAPNELEVKVNAIPEESSMKNLKNYEVLGQDGRKIEITKIENADMEDAVILTLEKDIPKGEVITVNIDNIKLDEDTTQTFGPSSIRILGGYSLKEDFSDNDYNDPANTVKDVNEIDEGAEIVFNGDTIPFEHSPIFENNIVLVPIDFFDKYIVGTFYTSYFERNDMVYLETPPSYHKSGIYDVRLKPGIDRAYKNTIRDPFENEEENKDKEIMLERAPEIIDGTVYLPLKDLCNILQIEYYYDRNENKIYLRDDKIDKYPSLHYAVRKNHFFPYQGKVLEEGKSLVKDKDSGEYWQVEYKAFSKINNKDGHLFAEYRIEDSNTGVENIKYEEIVLKDKYYKKDFEDDKWVELDKEHAKRDYNSLLLDALGPSYDEYEVVVKNKLYEDYRILPITKVGSVEVDGLLAEKYIIELDAEDMKSVIPKEDYISNKNILDRTYKGRIRYTMELYLKDEEIIKEVFRFYGEASDPEDQNNVEEFIDIEVDFKDIGFEIEIIPPDKDLIKPWQSSN